MAIDRAGLAGALGVPGWVTTTRLISAGIGEVQVPERWADMDMEQRRNVARDRVAAWVKLRKAAAKPGELISDGLDLTLAMPKGAGSDIIFTRLAQDMAAIGLRLRRVSLGDSADLRILDEVARYPAPNWFLTSCIAACIKFAPQTPINWWPRP
jgi:hypothetical protein